MEAGRRKGSGSAYRRIGVSAYRVWGSKTAFRQGHSDQDVLDEFDDALQTPIRRPADTPTRFRGRREKKTRNEPQIRA